MPGVAPIAGGLSKLPAGARVGAFPVVIFALSDEGRSCHSTLAIFPADRFSEPHFPMRRFFFKMIPRMPKEEVMEDDYEFPTMLYEAPEEASLQSDMQFLGIFINRDDYRRLKSCEANYVKAESELTRMGNMVINLRTASEAYKSAARQYEAQKRMWQHVAVTSFAFALIAIVTLLWFAL